MKRNITASWSLLINCANWGRGLRGYDSDGGVSLNHKTCSKSNDF